MQIAGGQAMKATTSKPASAKTPAIPLAPAPKYPTLYQVNTRVYLTELSRTLGRAATLDDFPEKELDRFASLGFDWIWLLSVWQTGAKSREVSRSHAEWRREFQSTLPDLTEDDIAGSGFAISEYKVSESLGGDAALARLRKRMSKRGLRLMLDFVPNHGGLDHPHLSRFPDYFVSGSDGDFALAPHNFYNVTAPDGAKRYAHGRDPYFPGWPDTLQFNYANAGLQELLIEELQRIADRCDGVRCDMAMLVLPEIFERTWGVRAEPFWNRAIEAVRMRHADFCFMAEVYWDLEWALQQEGFDYTYDKRLYDRLLHGHARPVREHLFAGLDFQDHLARFLENHDEPRIAATLPDEMHRAAAIVTYFTPGLRFFHQGQLSGRRVRISPHLIRGPSELDNLGLIAFYDRLLATLNQSPVRNGDWQLLECRPAWESNSTNDAFLAFAWSSAAGGRRLVVVNYSSGRSQSFVRWPWSDDGWKTCRFTDVMGESVYERDGNDLANRGLYLDLQAWGYHVFQVEQR
jgi:hypothetical protein